MLDTSVIVANADRSPHLCRIAIASALNATSSTASVAQNVGVALGAVSLSSLNMGSITYKVVIVL